MLPSLRRLPPCVTSQGPWNVVYSQCYPLAWAAGSRSVSCSQWRQQGRRRWRCGAEPAAAHAAVSGERPEQALERRLRESARVEERVEVVYSEEEFRRRLDEARSHA